VTTTYQFDWYTKYYSILPAPQRRYINRHSERNLSRKNGRIENDCEFLRRGDNMLEERVPHVFCNSAVPYQASRRPKYLFQLLSTPRKTQSTPKIITYIHIMIRPRESSKGLQGLRSLMREEQGCVRRKYKSNTSLSYSRMYLNSFDLVTSYSPVSQRVCILDLFVVGAGRTLKADHIAYYASKPPA
jgi:hypothetical protein